MAPSAVMAAVITSGTSFLERSSMHRQTRPGARLSNAPRMICNAPRRVGRTSSPFSSPFSVSQGWPSPDAARRVFWAHATMAASPRHPIMTAFQVPRVLIISQKRANDWVSVATMHGQAITAAWSTFAASHAVVGTRVSNVVVALTMSLHRDAYAASKPGPAFDDTMILARCNAVDVSKALDHRVRVDVDAPDGGVSASLNALVVLPSVHREAQSSGLRRAFLSASTRTERVVSGFGGLEHGTATLSEELGLPEP